MKHIQIYLTDQEFDELKRAKMDLNINIEWKDFFILLGKMANNFQLESDKKLVPKPVTNST